MRVATIDIGTNTVLLLVAERREGELVAIDERATITRLGQGVDKTRALAPDAIARTTACLDEYAKVIASTGATRVDVVGTSAMRDAAGSEVVRDHVRRVLGVDARVIGGEEEARLTFSGALLGLPGPSTGQPSRVATVFDIGGGSTEVVQGRVTDAATEIAFAHSYDVGSVRMTERHVRNDPPSRAELDAIEQDVAAIVDGAADAHGARLPPLADGEEPVGIAGTVTTLAAVTLALDPYDGARVHGLRLEREAIVSTVQKMASLPLDERRKLPGLEPKRADVIVAGGLIVLTLLDRWGAKALRVSDRGVRWGLALALCK